MGTVCQDLAALHACLDVVARISDTILGVVHTDSAALQFAITLKQKESPTQTHTRNKD